MKPFSLARVFLNITLLFAMSLALASGVALFAPSVNPLALAAGITFTVSFAQTAALSFGNASGRSPLALMALQVEIWHKDIVENLFKDNQFLNYAFNADEYVLQGSVVHIPNAGAKPNVVRNRSTLPAQVTERADVDITYSLDELTTDPIRIADADNYELSYNKRLSVMGDNYEAIREYAASLMMHKWAPDSVKGGSILRTTGTTGRPGAAPGASGNRRPLKLADIILAQKTLNKQDISASDRFMVVPSEMMADLRGEMSLTQERDFSIGANPETGVVGKLYGFNFIERSSTVVYKEGTPPTLVAFGAAGATDHCEAAIFWQKGAVERALGTVKMFENTNDPTYYGDIYSVLVRLGGRPRRADGKGFGAIVEVTV
jgi:hypothetical protein